MLADTEALYDDREGVESGFEGAFDNYVTNAEDPHKNLMAMAADAGCGFQGVKPMGNFLHKTPYLPTSFCENERYSFVN